MIALLSISYLKAHPFLFVVINMTNGTTSHIQAFGQTITLTGKTTYDSQCRVFSIIRMPAATKHYFPDLQKGKAIFTIKCFPDKASLLKHINEIDYVPLLLSLQKDNSFM